MTARRIRVALDAHTVGRRQTGNERYVVELGNALAARDDVELLAYLDKGQKWPTTDDAGAALPHVRHLRFRQPQLRIPLELPIRARRDRAELLHVSYVAPPVAGLPIVTAVHDLSFEDMPRLIPLVTRLRLKASVRAAVARSAAVLTGSEFTRSRLIDVYGLDPARVHAAPYGVGRDWQPLARDEGIRRLAALDVGRRFILFVGAAHPRKNLRRLIEAVAMLRREEFAGLELVLAGPPVVPDGELQRTIEALHATRWIRALGFVTDAELQALYCVADVVAYPSLYEGFGLPVLEALACGAIVVASSSTSLHEVAGDAALLVDPADTAAIGDALARALSDEPLRARLRSAGPEQAALFSWPDCAEKTAAAYHAALAR